MTKRLLLTLSIVLGALLFLRLSQQPAAAAVRYAPSGQTCATFDDISTSTSYTHGDSFTSNGVFTQVDPFTTAGGDIITGGAATSQAAGQSGGSGHELSVTNLNIVYEFFSSPIPTFTIKFGDYGNDVALAINNTIENRPTFSQFDGYAMDGVSISVIGGFGNDTGTIVLSGNIEAVIIGGQELFIDDACFAGEPPEENGCLDFSDADPGTELGVGSSISTDGVQLLGEVFTDTLGAPFVDGTFSIVNSAVAGGTAPELRLSAINAKFDVGSRFPDGLTFTANDQGGSLNLRVNGDFFNGENLEDLDGLMLGGVHIAVPSGGGENVVTVVQMSGAINEFTIGGQELSLDDLCPFTPPEPSCEPFTIDRTYGVDDNFDLGNGAEPATVNPWLLLTLQDNQNVGVPWQQWSTEFDDPRVNQRDVMFGHTFENIGPTHSQHILSSGSVTVRNQPTVGETPIPTEYAKTDHLVFAFYDQNHHAPYHQPPAFRTSPIYWLGYYEQTATNLGAHPGQWGLPTEMTFDLANLPASPNPGATANLLPHIESYGYLDYVHHDDARTDYLRIQLDYVCNEQEVETGDFGDAPDSTFNHTEQDYEAYSDTGVLGRFPTVFADTPNDEAVGPNHKDTDAVWLGNLVSDEQDADLFPDEDGELTNLSNGTPDLDLRDDGVDLDTIYLPSCGLTEFDYSVYNENATEPSYQLNVWIDFNRDGDWNDVLICQEGSNETLTVYEHAVSTSVIFNGFGLHELVTPAFPALSTAGEDVWMRVTLSDSAPPLDMELEVTDGRGPVDGYGQGESEDYLLNVPGEEDCQTNRGIIYGGVTDAGTLSGIGGIEVTAYVLNGVNWAAAGYGAVSNASGAYSMTVPADTYRLHLADPLGQYAAQWSSNKMDVNSADSITISPCGDEETFDELDLEADVPDPIKVLDGNADVWRDPETGLYTLSVLRPQGGEIGDVVICVTLTCDDNSTPTNVRIVIDGTEYPMTPGADPDTWVVTVPGSALHEGASIAILYDCNDDPQIIPFEPIRLYDPSGFITDINTDQPIDGATVTLYHVPNWRAATAAGDAGPMICESNLSKPPAQDWSQAAPAGQGVLLAPDLGRYSPADNRQTTGADGYYGWDVAAGCWYVVVEAAGYHTLISPVVGVPTEVTDLDLQLTPTAPPTAISLSTGNAMSTAPLLLIATLATLLVATMALRRRRTH